jgi:putative nucleotidyltransferase with HDIG domain
VDQVAIISDSSERADALRSCVAERFTARWLVPNALSQSAPSKYIIVDLDLANGAHLADLRHWLGRKPKHAKAIFIVEACVHHQVVQALSIGATHLVPRPFDSEALLTTMLGDISAMAGNAEALALDAAGVSAGIDALQKIFGAFLVSAPVDLNFVNSASESVVSDIEADGLIRWIDIVRRHHSQTYQHCLLVTGIAVGFGRYLGFSGADKQRLALAGLLHDIGKARIPITVLEKPGPLDEAEMALMKGHPVFGFEALHGMPELDPEMVDMVLHHHEYLDGSGYPHGLGGREISDLVRIMTIADVFGALIERRSYRAPLSSADAYQILHGMGPKLDPDLVRAFGPFALQRMKYFGEARIIRERGVVET